MVLIGFHIKKIGNKIYYFDSYAVPFVNNIIKN